MISLLRGTIGKGEPGRLTVDVQGVGYAVVVPLDVWENVKEGEEQELLITAFIREDRFDLFGFTDSASKALFEAAIAMAGIGTKLGLELCSFPRHLLLTAIEQQDIGILTSIKGIGKKTAEKLLLDLKSLTEKKPEIFAKERTEAKTVNAQYDQDAIAALSSLGYNTPTILNALKNIPDDITSPEERVAAALRSM